LYWETYTIKLLKVGERFAGLPACQSRAKPRRNSGKCVETGRAAPNGISAYGEGTVQTTNAQAAAKAEVV